MFHCVITTIQRPTPSVKRLANSLAGSKGHLVIAGDTKGPDSFDLSDVDGFALDQLSFLTIEDQQASDFKLAEKLPTKHYARKNLGYLHAIKNGASCIYETDDDNAPMDNWSIRTERVNDAVSLTAVGTETPAWVNVYRHFSDENIWPRGLPLDRIHAEFTQSSVPSESENPTDGQWAPIQQGLADGSPDVDAIWRLVLDREFEFNQSSSVLLAPGQWCPFNTQTTWWWPAVYPLLYVPSYCSFRMCDIWKSFVAQRCLWELGTGVVFHAPEVWQERNIHNLLRDFSDEIPGYEQNHQIASILESVSLKKGPESVSANLETCYAALVKEGIFPETELELVGNWVSDLKAIG